MHSGKSWCGWTVLTQQTRICITDEFIEDTRAHICSVFVAYANTALQGLYTGDEKEKSVLLALYTL